MEKDTLRNYHLKPICEIECNLLALLDKQVPLYLVQNLYYKLNDIDINSEIFNNPKILNNKTN